MAGAGNAGHEVPIEISLSSIQTADGLLAMALVTDVSERRSLERAARQHEKLAALATASAGIAHELNNPIGIISTRLEVMLQDAQSQPLPSEVVDDLHVLHRNIQRVIRIARGLLSFARQSSEELRPVLLNAVIEHHPVPAVFRAPERSLEPGEIKSSPPLGGTAHGTLMPQPGRVCRACRRPVDPVLAQARAQVRDLRPD